MTLHAALDPLNITALGCFRSLPRFQQGKGGTDKLHSLLKVTPRTTPRLKPHWPDLNWEDRDILPPPGQVAERQVLTWELLRRAC